MGGMMEGKGEEITYLYIYSGKHKPKKLKYPCSWHGSTIESIITLRKNQRDGDHAASYESCPSISLNSPLQP
jgi:hypothetical protein